MKSLLRRVPYFRRYRATLLRGVLYIFLSTVFAVIAPIIIRDAVDGLQSDLTSETLLQYALMIVGVALLSGVF
ncbi:MAG: ABC transporter ATP-binding protein, partial [Bacteroidetes bacterium]|nr:ABC transporter ATP-binding protein [Bacteroidota bacterium]